MDVLGNIRRILCNSLDRDPGEITPDSRLVEDLGADSLDSVELVMVLEDELGIEIDDSELDGVKTVGQLVEIVGSKLAKTP